MGGGQHTLQLHAIPRGPILPAPHLVRAGARHEAGQLRVPHESPVLVEIHVEGLATSRQKVYRGYLLEVLRLEVSQGAKKVNIVDNEAGGENVPEALAEVDLASLRSPIRVCQKAEVALKSFHLLQIDGVVGPTVPLDEVPVPLQVLQHRAANIDSGGGAGPRLVPCCFRGFTRLDNGVRQDRVHLQVVDLLKVHLKPLHAALQAGA
mmetsp:Transcript_112607/g.240400  ORF Transcript_112607/g.240400 Transcript_112607/m.240400 type:complete len:207 (-) Transcript_112607:1159-1779(-)